MKENKIGFIGCGNMGSAMIGGIINKNILDSKDIYVYDNNTEKLYNFCGELNSTPAKTAKELAEKCKYIILAVKPYVVKPVLNEIKDIINAETIIISIAAGVTVKVLKEASISERVVRVMPNTPALVGEGVSAVVFNEKINSEEKDFILELLKTLGPAYVVDEKLMDAVGAVSGSGPAYVYMFIEALADAGVLGGLDRQLSYKLAAQTVLGSAKMVLETGKHPGALKDDVCSPGGSTIEGVKSFEENGFRGSIIDAAVAVMNKTKKMAEEQ